ncbi:MAG: ATP-binding protein [Pseudomonadota bacterium]
MSVDAQRTFAARMDALPQAAAFIEGFCEQQGIAHGDALRMTLIVEELFSNTVSHGHGGDSVAPVCLTLQAGVTQLRLLYADAAPPFDPLARLGAAAAELEADVAERPVGHLGIPLVVRMASSVSYAREDGWNRLRVVLTRS